VPWVFFRPNGQPIGDFKRAWTTARRKAGIPGRLFHDFRRTAVRGLVRAGLAESVAMKMTGHKTNAIFKRYAIVDESLLRELAASLAVPSSKVEGKVDRIPGRGVL
jgi:integrase